MVHESVMNIAREMRFGDGYSLSQLYIRIYFIGALVHVLQPRPKSRKTDVTERRSEADNLDVNVCFGGLCDCVKSF